MRTLWLAVVVPLLTLAVLNSEARYHQYHQHRHHYHSAGVISTTTSTTTPSSSGVDSGSNIIQNIDSVRDSRHKQTVAGGSIDENYKHFSRNYVNATGKSHQPLVGNSSAISYLNLGIKNSHNLLNRNGINYSYDNNKNGIQSNFKQNTSNVIRNIRSNDRGASHRLTQQRGLSTHHHLLRQIDYPRLDKKLDNFHRFNQGGARGFQTGHLENVAGLEGGTWKNLAESNVEKEKYVQFSKPLGSYRYKPYGKQHPGRHVCTSHKNYTQPVKTVQPYCKPVLKKVTFRCQKNQICGAGTRKMYQREFRGVMSTRNVSEVTYFCCPGWSRDNSKSYSCNKPQCSKPCLNDGICMKPDKCYCMPGFSGPQCENNLLAPLCLLPCLNGGSCSTQGVCHCPAGYTGSRCEQDIDECITSPCEQICINIPGSFLCRCHPGYAITNERGNCSSTPRCRAPCENGGSCLENDQCVCAEGFTGPRCQWDRDECKEKKPCDHICLNTPGSYRCYCKEGFILQADKESCVKEDFDGTTIETKELEFESLDKRLYKLESLMDENHKNDVTKNDFESVREGMKDITNNLDGIRNQMSADLESYKNDLMIFKKRLHQVEMKAEKIDDLLGKYQGIKI